MHGTALFADTYLDALEKGDMVKIENLAVFAEWQYDAEGKKYRSRTPRRRKISAWNVFHGDLTRGPYMKSRGAKYPTTLQAAEMYWNLSEKQRDSLRKRTELMNVAILACTLV